MSGEPDECFSTEDDILEKSDPAGPPPGGNVGTTSDGIKLPSLPTTSYSYDPIIYNWYRNHKSNGSYRENFRRGDRDLNSVLVGGYVKTGGPADAEILCKMGGGKPTNSDNGKAGRCYIIGLALNGTRVRIRKENPHPSVYDTGANVILSLGERRGHYTGIMGMKVNVIQNGLECVRLIGYVDTAGMSDTAVFTASAQNWVKTIDVTDTGQLGEWPAQGIWLTTATPGNSIVTIRTDEQHFSTYDFRLGFAARIKGGPAY